MTYSVLDVSRRELIGFVSARSFAEALRITREEFNSAPWNTRFPFSAVVGQDLAIRPDHDQDPYFLDHGATLMPNIQTYSRPTDREISVANSSYGEHLI